MQQSETDQTLFFKPFWRCSQRISLSATDLDVRRYADAAVTVWRARLSQYADVGLPQFDVVTQGSGGDVDVVSASPSTTAANWCGQTDPISGVPRKRITLRATNCNGNKDTQQNILIHELAHALGWTSGAHTAGDAAGHSDQCAVVLPSDNLNRVNTSVCPHEIEGILYRYSIRTDIDLAHFWDRDFVLGTSTDRTERTLGAGGTVQLSAGAFSWNGGSEPWPAETQQWSSNNPSVAQVGWPGFVTAVANGSTYIRVSAMANPAGHYLPYWLLDRGDSIKVSVVIPVDTFLRVNTIDFPRTLPIQVADSFDLTAAVAGDGGQGGVTLSWVIRYSNGILPNDSTAFQGGTTYFLRVPTGSYRITARAYPKQGSKVGAPAEVALTVCPVPGQYLLAVPGHGTDAVQGC